MSIDECRIKEFFLSYLLKRAERSLRLVGVVTPTPRRATSTIRQSSIFIRHSMKFHTRSYKVMRYCWLRKPPNHTKKYFFAFFREFCGWKHFSFAVFVAGSQLAVVLSLRLQFFCLQPQTSSGRRPSLSLLILFSPLTFDLLFALSPLAFSLSPSTFHFSPSNLLSFPLPAFSFALLSSYLV